MSLALGCLFLGGFALAIAQEAKFTLYEAAGCNTRSRSFTGVQTDFPNMTNFKFDNSAVSVKVQGVWMFYDNYSYEGGTVEYYFSKDYKCIDLKGTKGKVSSARFAGYPNDMNLNFINFYQGTYFTFEEVATSKDLPSINLEQPPASLIVTGSIPWSIYDQPNFTGNAKCVRPAKSTPFFVPNLSETLPGFKILSVKRGCANVK